MWLVLIRLYICLSMNSYHWAILYVREQVKVWALKNQSHKTWHHETLTHSTGNKYTQKWNKKRYIKDTVANIGTWKTDFELYSLHLVLSRIMNFLNGGSVCSCEIGREKDPWVSRMVEIIMWILSLFYILCHGYWISSSCIVFID